MPPNIGYAAVDATTWGELVTYEKYAAARRSTTESTRITRCPAETGGKHDARNRHVRRR